MSAGISHGRKGRKGKKVLPLASWRFSSLGFSKRELDELAAFKLALHEGEGHELQLPASLFLDNIRIAGQPDVMAGSGRLSGYDHQSTAWLVALPGVLNISERDPFRVYLKVSFCGVRNDFLKGFDQNVASWNPRSAQNCQCRTT